jgi:hypothetical protein
MLGQPQRLVSEGVGGAAVVGGRARQPTTFKLDVADVESREAGDHSTT